ncbi:autophagy-related protein 9A [Tetranychus urticae]|uniref:autophagy-related protein 9A n=1 Tax=Tetranychus urticae TaxID=32264 RepID=UPI00077B9A35|nr:autophagy-related protein 9A [Tetranychus urticae]
MSTTSYRSFSDLCDPEDKVLIHVLPENKGGPRSWHQYINDLDYFFTRIYRYHQRSGFLCLVLQHILELVQFIFVVLLTLFLLNFVDYAVLFKDKLPPGSKAGDPTIKVTISDVILPQDQIHLGGFQIILLICAAIFWFLKLLKVLQAIYVYHAIRVFYAEALHIQDCSEYTWQEVQTRLIQAQHLCSLQEGTLTELDIHNRILRYHNYMIALLNKNLLPIHYKVPLLGEQTYFSKGLEFNIRLLLFKGPFAIFENSWKLKDEFKSTANRQICARKFAKNCLILGFINLALLPLIFIWQVLYIFYAYAGTLKRDPSSVFASKNWSHYAKLFCRHFNELDHQLNGRLSKGYKAASKYMDSFNSPLMEVISRNVMFMAGALLAVLVLLTFYDEDVIAVEHVITIIAALGIIVAVARGFIPDDIPMKYNKSELYSHILLHIHYAPHRYSPYTSQAQAAMSKLFQYKIQAILEDLLSPLITPYILLFHLRPRSLEFVDFFRNYTVEVSGTGDICIFAMMNVKKNGNPVWEVQKEEKLSENPFAETPSGASVSGKIKKTDGQRKFKLQAGAGEGDFGEAPPTATVPENLFSENGKLELSLINFQLTNPNWHPIDRSQRQFIEVVTSKAIPSMHEKVESVDIGRTSTEPVTPHSSMMERVPSMHTHNMNPPRTPHSSLIEDNTGYSHRDSYCESFDLSDIELRMSLTSRYLNDLASSRLSNQQPEEGQLLQQSENAPLLQLSRFTERHDIQ